MIRILNELLEFKYFNISFKFSLCNIMKSLNAMKSIISIIIVTSELVGFIQHPRGHAKSCDHQTGV